MRNTTTSLLEKELFEAVKIVIPGVIKLVDRKRALISKPHIRGFDIDIFNPKTNLGVEFDR